MRNAWLLVLMLLLAFETECCGTVSEDTYVRRDVFEVYMQGVNSKLDMILEQMRAQRKEMNAQREEMNAQLKAQREEMNAQLKAQREEMNAQLKAQREEMNAQLKAQREEMNVQLKEQREGMNAQLKELKDEMSVIRAEQESQRENINELVRVVSVMSERLDRNFDTLSARIDGLDKRMDNQQNYLYLVLVILGIIVALPTVQKMLQAREDRKDALRAFVTLEDVKRLIEESSLNLASKTQP